MKVADPDRGFRKFKEDLQKKRDLKENKIQRTETSHEPTNNNYNNYIPSRPMNDSDAIQSQLNNIQQQINNINKPQPQVQPQPIPVYAPAPVQQPIIQPIQQPVQQTVNKPREQVSLTGVGFITLFLTGVMAYMYQIDSFVQSNVDKVIDKMHIYPNLLFGGIAVLGVCLIIAGIFRKR